MSNAPASGTKHDNGKPALSMIPPEALRAAARALMYGANKYGRDNYKGGIVFTRLGDAALRHLTAWLSGEEVDSESGLMHLDHALATLSMLAWMQANRSDLDDRTKK